MATIRYTFRPSVFTSERTVVIDGSGVAELRSDGGETRIPWTDVAEIHVEPGTSPDETARFVLHVNAANRTSIAIDSLNVRSAVDFEDKTQEFLEVLKAVHESLAKREAEVRFLYGAKRGVLTAWRIALWLTLATGIFAAIAGVISEQYDLLFGSVAFIGAGLSGLAVLRGRKGPRTYTLDESAGKPRSKDPIAG
jgi:hypothetical protein